MQLSSLFNISKINSLRRSIDRHNDFLAKLLLTSKESSEKCAQIESAFRTCKKAFVEVASALVNLLEKELARIETDVEDIKKAVREVLN